MRSFAATIPVLAGFLALATAGELPLTPVASYPPTRPTPQPPSVFTLTQVPANPTVTGTPTQPDRCSQVAARITPQLTPRPTYPPTLKAMADKMGGVELDTCGEMDFNGKFKSVESSDLNRFTQVRYSTFIVPIWAKVHQLWQACGEETGKIHSVAQDPCYRWALELSKSSNSTSVDNISKGKFGAVSQAPSWRLVRPRVGSRTLLLLALSGC
ncbi:hypothetical protein C8A00DRAFT_41478 [Chaetomidium leptoderma]|uniref:Uncharacterized protein n=1 Tax=Chaetomidium leptoderma TaxID=669021 RepID=A0AAN6VRN4_9PEZI|nr:hypothetical protein C8A00DRAFT_41478 [Chaetomidium leptoderma]